MESTENKANNHKVQDVIALSPQVKPKDLLFS
jgi:hypothetical protein